MPDTTRPCSSAPSRWPPRPSSPSASATPGSRPRWSWSARKRHPSRTIASEMTNSISGQATAVERPPGKRDRLIAAAVLLLHRHGVERTTLADIAKAADVPVGNVYYYFKTKDEVI